MNKLRTAALATGLFVAGSFGAFELDKSLNETLAREKIECHNQDPSQAKACVSEIDNAHESEYMVIEVLEIGLLFGAAVSGIEFAKELRKQSPSSLEDIFSNK